MLTKIINFFIIFDVLRASYNAYTRWHSLVIISLASSTTL